MSSTFILKGVHQEVDPTTPARPPTVEDLVAHFALRRRAATREFLAGTAIAAARRVRLVLLTAAEVTALVDDDPVCEVVLRVVGEDLTAACTCGAVAPDDACRHAVAAAHALWVHRRPEG
jgi:uncharacterized Zn finger protein